jgi:hypothetical protein
MPCLYYDQRYSLFDVVVARNIERMKDEDVRNSPRQYIVDVIMKLQEVAQSSYENK